MTDELEPCDYVPMTTSFYLGPGAQRFAPTSWNDIEIAAAAGVLDETRWVELKKDVPASSKGSNRELAKDLASLSVDGGVLIIGIEEAKAGVAGNVTGADLGSLQARISQVTGSTIQPPLHVSTRSFAHPTNNALGVMIVSIPASASAPHMVDNSYWGRSEHGKQTLGDHDVRRLISGRDAARAGFVERLASVGSQLRAPAADERDTGQLVLRLEPLAASYPSPPWGPLKGLFSSPLDKLGLAKNQLSSPRLVDADQPMAHPRGWAATSLRKQDNEARASVGMRALEYARMTVLVEDSGSWSVLSGGAVRPNSNRPDDTELCTYTRHVLELTHIVCSAVAEFSTTMAPYNGEWRVGVCIDNLAGRPPAEAFSSNSQFVYATFEPFPEDTYQAVCMTTTQELSEQPNEVVVRLLRGFLRGMDLEDVYFPYTELSQKIANENFLRK